MSNHRKVLEFLIEHNLEIATAESLTGGMIASRIVGMPGVSEVFKQGFVTYSNEAKHDILGVRQETLNVHGAVSRECSREMAYFAKKISRAHIGLSSTGIAGPSGGSKDKPVGLCYLSCAIDDYIITRKYIFKGPRMLVRFKCTNAAMDLLNDALKKYF